MRSNTKLLPVYNHLYDLKLTNDFLDTVDYELDLLSQHGCVKIDITENCTLEYPKKNFNSEKLISINLKTSDEKKSYYKLDSVSYESNDLTFNEKLFKSLIKNDLNNIFDFANTTLMKKKLPTHYDSESQMKKQIINTLVPGAYFFNHSKKLEEDRDQKIFSWLLNKKINNDYPSTINLDYNYFVITEVVEEKNTRYAFARDKWNNRLLLLQKDGEGYYNYLDVGRCLIYKNSAYGYYALRHEYFFMDEKEKRRRKEKESKNN